MWIQGTDDRVWRGVGAGDWLVFLVGFQPCGLGILSSLYDFERIVYVIYTGSSVTDKDMLDNV